MNTKHLFLGGGVLVVAALAVTASQNSLQGSLSTTMTGRYSSTTNVAMQNPTTPPPATNVVGSSTPSSNNASSTSQVSSSQSSASSQSASFVSSAPCTLSYDYTAMDDNQSRFFGIETADAQKPVAPCFAKPFNNACGDANSKAPICGGKCANPRATCQVEDPSDPNSNCACLTTIPEDDCGEGGAACSGKCPKVGGKIQVCALRLVGDRTSCKCEDPSVVPCGWQSGVCAIGYCKSNPFSDNPAMQPYCDAKTCTCVKPGS